MKTIALLVMVGCAVILPCYASDYKPWSENLFSYINKEYGKDAEKRMRYLNKLALENQDKTDFEKLTLANTTFNLFPWISDKDQWHKADYWADPLEIITTFGGDCEDMVFGKWTLLRHLGIPRNKLLFAYAKIRRSDSAHMVLLYTPTPDIPIGKADFYVLDNMVGEIKLGEKRTDLEGVYVFTPEGKIYGLKDRADGSKRTVTNVLKPRHFKNLDDLRERFIKDREKLKEMNDGEYLLPDL